MLATKENYNRLHAIWRLFPESGRRFLFHKLIPLLAPRPDKAPSPRSPISILGPFRSSIGIGWGARANAELLTGKNFDLQLYDITDMLLAGDLADTGLAAEPTLPHGPGVLALYVNPPLIPYIFLHLRRSAIAGKYVICHSVWELPELYQDWKRDLRFVHRIWCPSEFAANAFRRATDKPVHVIPYAIEAPPDAFANREEFGLTPDDFVVFLTIHLASGLSRKNPVAAIQAFRNAFPKPGNAVLLVKVSQGHAHPDRLEVIQRAIEGAENIRVIQATLSDLDYWKLLRSVDVVLSLHRSEGFGLVPAQAMALGKVAIATGWSGNMAYMDAENSLPIDYTFTAVNDPEGNYISDGQEWAEPNIEHATELLRQLAGSESVRKRLGRAAIRTMRTKFSSEAVVNIIRKEFSDLGPSIK